MSSRFTLNLLEKFNLRVSYTFHNFCLSCFIALVKLRSRLHHIEQAFLFSFALKRQMFHNILNNVGKTLANEISQLLGQNKPTRHSSFLGFQAQSTRVSYIPVSYRKKTCILIAGLANSSSLSLSFSPSSFSILAGINKFVKYIFSLP